MSVYDRLKKRRRILLGVLVADFIIVALSIGPLSIRYSAPLLTVLSFAAISVFVARVISLGRLGVRCPRCGTLNTLSGSLTPPRFRSNCGSDLSPGENGSSDA